MKRLFVSPMVIIAKGNKKGRGKNKITNHHIIPSSRNGPSNLENIAGVERDRHRAYHFLFENKTPDEIIKCLVDEYWNGQVYHVDEFYRNYHNKSK